MKIYTKTGDRGETGLLGGQRVKKNSPEIEAIGEVDELNALIGVLTAALTPTDADSRDSLSLVQHRLFTIGANLASVPASIGNIPKILPTDIEALEKWIDVMEAQLSTLKQFILPAGAMDASLAFLARANCRRAERRVVALREIYPALDPLILQYLNRLSDTLFVLGRWLNNRQSVADIPWGK